MQDDLSTDLSILESHLDGMLGRIHDNSVTLRRFQLFEKKLLSLNSLSEMVEMVLTDAREFFDLDVISFCLIDEKQELAGYLAEDGYKVSSHPGLVFLQDKELLRTTFGFAMQPFLGAYKSAKCGGFFPNRDKRIASVAIIPLTRRGKYLGSLNLGSLDPSRFVDGMATDFVEHMAAVVSMCLENHLNFEILRRTSLMDTLTGVNNRRFLEQRLGEEIDRSQRSAEPLTCFFLDIDFFKKVNDEYGRQIGDQVLALVARTVREQFATTTYWPVMAARSSLPCCPISTTPSQSILPNASAAESRPWRSTAGKKNCTSRYPSASPPMCQATQKRTTPNR